MPKTMMLYILNTETHASFDNMADAQAYYRQLKDDEPYAEVMEPRHNPNDGLIVVMMSKSEDVQASRPARTQSAA